MSKRQTLRRGDRSVEVFELTQILFSKNFIAHVDVSFDAVVEDAVQVFQETQGLKSDGIVGPNTWAALEGKKTALGSEGKLSVLRAFSRDKEGSIIGRVATLSAIYLSVAEAGEIDHDNQGLWVAHFAGVTETTLHRRPGSYPWCAHMVSRLIRDACDALGCEMPIDTTGRAQSIYRDGLKKGYTLEPGVRPLPGDLVVWWRGKSARSGAGHVGFVVHAEEAGQLITVEGNAAKPPTPILIKKYKDWRDLEKLIGFVRLPQPLFYGSDPKENFASVSESDWLFDLAPSAGVYGGI